MRTSCALHIPLTLDALFFITIYLTSCMSHNKSVQEVGNILWRNFSRQIFGKFAFIGLNRFYIINSLISHIKSIFKYYERWKENILDIFYNSINRNSIWFWVKMRWHSTHIITSGNFFYIQYILLSSFGFQYSGCGLQMMGCQLQRIHLLKFKHIFKSHWLRVPLNLTSL